MDKGARESITNFEKGVGDVAITYENEVLVGSKAGQTYEYVVPALDDPDREPRRARGRLGGQARHPRRSAEAFLDFLWSPEAQRAFAEYGLRPVDPEVATEVEAQFPAVEDLWTIDDLGRLEEGRPKRSTVRRASGPGSSPRRAPGR